MITYVKIHLAADLKLVHGANGYLPHQFLDTGANKRTDQWGGSVENRARFTIEAMKALIDVWGPARVGIKLNPAGGYNDVGSVLYQVSNVSSVH